MQISNTTYIALYIHKLKIELSRETKSGPHHASINLKKRKLRKDTVQQMRFMLFNLYTAQTVVSISGPWTTIYTNCKVVFLSWGNDLGRTVSIHHHVGLNTEANHVNMHLHLNVTEKLQNNCCIA